MVVGAGDAHAADPPDAPDHTAGALLTGFADMTDWAIVEGTWEVSGGELVGTGSVSSEICGECSRERPLTSARVTYQVEMPSVSSDSPATLTLGLRNASGLERIGVELADLGRDTVSSVLVKTTDGESRPLDDGARSTERSWSAPPGSIQNVEIEWYASNVLYRIWPADSPRPGAPTGGHTLAGLDVWPDRAEITTSAGQDVRITGYAVDLVEAGYPAELDAPEPIDPHAWQQFSGSWEEQQDGGVRSTSDGADAAIARALCPDCSPGSTIDSATVSAEFVVPVAEELADSTWASTSLMLVAADTSQRLYLAGLVGSQSKFEAIRSDRGSETRLDSTGFAWTPGERYRVEAAWSGTSYEVRAWPASQERPEDAQLTFAAPAFSPALGGFRQWGVRTAAYSDLEVAGAVTTPGDPPPLVTTGTQGLFLPVEREIVPAPSYEEIRSQLPTPVVDGDPDYVEAYEKTWQILVSENLLEPDEDSPLVRTYVDAGFDPSIMFQWDTLFSLRYALYGQGAFDMISTLDNWYAFQSPTGEIRRAYDTNTGQVHPWASGPNGVNPPLFAWVELAGFHMTGDVDRVERVLPALRAYADWVSIQQWSQNTPHQLFWNNGNGNGMDNLPTQLGQGGDGTSNPVGNIDISSQIVLMRNSLAELELVAGNETRAALDRAWASAIADRIQEFGWNEDDGRFYEVDAQGEQWKVDSLAGFWPLLAGVASEEQSNRLVSALADPSVYWTDMVFPTLAKTDERYDPKGHYWLGGVWAPATFSTIKGVEAIGNAEFARDASTRYLDGIVDVFDYSGTLWEMYAPEAQPASWIGHSYTGRKSGERIPVVAPGVELADGLHIAPGTDEGGSEPNAEGGSDLISKPDFAGWTGLAPIALLIENVIGIQADVPSGTIEWDLTRTDRNGLENLSLGEAGSLSMIADARASSTSETRICFEGDLSSPFTVDVRFGEAVTPVLLDAGAVDTCRTVGPDGDDLPGSGGDHNGSDDADDDDAAQGGDDGADHGDDDAAAQGDDDGADHGDDDAATGTSGADRGDQDDTRGDAPDEAGPSDAGGRLPQTGAGVDTLLLSGSLLLLAGWLLVARHRRSRRA
ncbi:trehalase family glycosidase [Pseudactinotalea sp. HY158]|uniref:MGH1-like glycoside hydrolase domain-containing protein n=1 Tax=Pseudactinotalea sp. HY158 TaxID=2654547 RepID=UPI0018925FA6|nr:trehalase family glycosidase [Pseudactinotalea sp. HY158]